MTPQDLAGVLASAIVATSAGSMAPGRLSALAAGARALVAVWDATDVAERLDRLEAAIGRRPS